MPRIYEFRVTEQLPSTWTTAFENLLLIRYTDGGMVLHGALPDQAALHAVLERIRDLGLTLVSVQSAPVGGPASLSGLVSDSPLHGEAEDAQ